MKLILTILIILDMIYLDKKDKINLSIAGKTCKRY